LLQASAFNWSLNAAKVLSLLIFYFKSFSFLFSNFINLKTYYFFTAFKFGLSPKASVYENLFFLYHKIY